MLWSYYSVLLQLSNVIVAVSTVILVYIKPVDSVFRAL